MTGISGIVLLGGGSRRMGSDKAWLRFGDTTLVQRTATVVAEVADELVLVRAPGTPPAAVECDRPVIELTDPIEDGGPLVGLIAGLDAARYPTAVVTSVDQPFLQAPLLRLLASQLEALQPAGVRWLLPVLDGQVQPLCSAFTTDSSETLRAYLDAGERSLVALEGRLPTARLEEADWRTVDPMGLSFMDVDTPEEYAAALERLEALDEKP